MTYEDLTPEERREMIDAVREFMDAARRQKCERIEFSPDALRILADNNAALIIRVYGDAPLIEQDTTLSDPDLAGQVGQHVRTERLPAINDEHA